MGGSQPSASSNPSVPPLPTGAENARAELPPVSLFKDRFLISGPESAAKDFVSQIPGLGAPYSDVAQARQGAKQQAERMVEALLKSTQGSRREQEQLAPVIGIVPSALIGGDAYGNKLITLATTLQDMLKTYEAQGRDDSGLSPTDKAKARQKAAVFRNSLDNIGLPPIVMNEGELDKYPPGTEVLWNGTTPITRQNRVTGGR